MMERLQDDMLYGVTGGAQTETANAPEAPCVSRRCHKCGRDTPCTVTTQEGTSGPPDFIHFEKITYVCTVCGRVSVTQRKI